MRRLWIKLLQRQFCVKILEQGVHLDCVRVKRCNMVQLFFEDWQAEGLSAAIENLRRTLHD